MTLQHTDISNVTVINLPASNYWKCLGLTTALVVLHIRPHWGLLASCMSSAITTVTDAGPGGLSVSRQERGVLGIVNELCEGI